MKRVLAIVAMGLFGFCLAVGVATLLLVRKQSMQPLEPSAHNVADMPAPLPATEKKLCPDSILSTEIVSEVVDEATREQRVVLCRPGMSPVVLFEESAGATTSGFATPLSEDEIQSRITLEAKGDLDGDTIPEFVLGFGREGSTCPFVGVHRIAKVGANGSVALSMAFGECLANPKIQKTASGSEVILAGVNGGDGVRVFWSGSSWVTEVAKGGAAPASSGENLKPVAPAYPAAAPTAQPHSAP
jgi:hypothetical protein